MDQIWFHYKQVSDEYKMYEVLSLRKQLMNIVNYLALIYNILFYKNVFKHIERIYTSSTNVYIKYEWPLYKPLLNSKLSKTVNDVLLRKTR